MAITTSDPNQSNNEIKWSYTKEWQAKIDKFVPQLVSILKEVGQSSLELLLDDAMDVYKKEVLGFTDEEIKNGHGSSFYLE